jgi:hypothetical protein
MVALRPFLLWPSVVPPPASRPVDPLAPLAVAAPPPPAPVPPVNTPVNAPANAAAVSAVVPYQRTPTYIDLPPDIQRAAHDRMLRDWKDPAALRGYAGLVNSDAFIGAGKAAQLAALDALSVRPSDRELSKDLRAQLGDPAFRALDASVQEKLLSTEPGFQHADRAELKALAQSKAFGVLSPEVQNQAIDDLAKNPKANNDVFFQIHGDGFAQLPVSTQKQAIDIAAKPGASRDVQDAAARLTAAPEFAKLDPASQGKWLDAIGSDDQMVADRAAKLAAHFLDLPAYQDRSVDEKALILKKLARGAAEPDTVEAKPGDWDRFATPSKVKDLGAVAKSSDFVSDAPQAAHRYRVDVGGDKIEVVIPDQPDPKGGVYPTVDEIAKSLELMPPSSRREIKKIVVEPKDDPSASALSRGHGVVSLYPTAEHRSKELLTTTLTHESGHLLGGRIFGPLAQKLTKGWQEWEQAGDRDGRWPSSYATHSIDEDIAESVALYQRVHGTREEATWRAAFPARFAILDRIVRPN